MLRTWCLVLALAAVALAQDAPSPQLINEEVEEPTPDPPVYRYDASYWITCSNKVRRGHDYICQAQILKGSEKVKVTVTLRTYDGKRVVIPPYTTDVEPGAVRDIIVPIPVDLEAPSDVEWKRSYNLTIEGESPLVNFRNTTSVLLELKTFSIFVQTDKGIYKYGQLVQFRVLATTPDLRPLSGEPMDIYIEDPNENRVWQRLGVRSTNGYGVLDDFNFPLVDGLPTGTWTIIVEAAGMKVTQTFIVDNYQLPRFEVEIEAPTFGIISDSLLDIVITAKYTFGQPVTSGNVEFKLSLPTYYYYSRDQVAITDRGQLDSEGKFHIQISKQSMLDYLMYNSRYNYGIRSLSGYNFKMEANVTEGNTLRTQGKVRYIQYYESALLMNFMSISPDTLKPGLRYSGMVELMRRDKTLFPPEIMTTIRVRFNVTYGVPRPPPTTTPPPLDSENTTSSSNGSGSNGNDNGTSSDGSSMTLARKPTMDIMPIYPPYQPDDIGVLQLDQPERSVPATGWVPISFEVPANATWARIHVECVKVFEGVSTQKYLTKAFSPTGAFVQLSVGPKRHQVGDEIQVTARSTIPVRELHYQVYTKGMLYGANTLQGNPYDVEFTFPVFLDKMAAPSVRIIAFYRTEDDNEFAVDALSLNVDGIFQKNVSLEFSREQVEPRKPVDLIVRAEPNSLVFLLSNDKSVLLLDEGNDINSDVVREDLMSYDYGRYYPWMRYMYFCGVPSYFGGNDANSIFSNADVLILTDAHVPRQSYWYEDEMYLRPEVALPESGGEAFDQDDSTSSTTNKGQDFTPAEQIRRFFPENWLWRSVYIGDGTGETVISTTAPDTITSWITTAFSMHPAYGLGVSNKAATLTTFRYLFLTLDLPLSITKGEDYCFTVTVFNYHEDPQMVLVTVKASVDFLNLHPTRNSGAVPLEGVQGDYSRLLGDVLPGTSEANMFCIRPTSVGRVALQVHALTKVQGLSDAVEKYINVKPEGVPRATTYPYLIDLSGPDGYWSQEVDITFPSRAESGSEMVTFSTAGNLLGPTLANLDDLLRMPYGCGEQNMLNFAPTVFVTFFYYKTGTNDTEKIEKSKLYMSVGAMKELKYEHRKTGSFSTFGNNKNTTEKGSLWLTAFVTKTFAQGVQLNKFEEGVFELDMRVLERSVDWMSRQVNSEGEFKEYGKVFNKRMQGGSAKGEALTAYTLLALVEAEIAFEDTGNTRIMRVIKAALKKGGAYLESQLAEVRDPYTACIVAYVLELLNSNRAEEAFQLVESLATVDDAYKFWKRQTRTSRPRYDWSRTEDAISIEATAYCLLLYNERGVAITDGLPIIRWLANQRGRNGGFISTQDSVIGLEALAAVTTLLYSNEDIPLTVTVTYRDSNGDVMLQDSMGIDKSKELLLQRINIPYTPPTVEGQVSSLLIEAQTDNGQPGRTGVMAEVVLDYYIQLEETIVTYETDHRLTFTEFGFELTIDIRTLEEEPESMTMLRVQIPPGFIPDLDNLSYNRYVSMVETDTLEGYDVVIYFDTDVITRRGVSVTIIMDGLATDVLLKPLFKSYTVINYYNTDEQVTKMYTIDRDMGVCERVPLFSFCPFWLL